VFLTTFEEKQSRYGIITVKMSFKIKL